MPDLLIHNGTLITPEGPRQSDLIIENGQITGFSGASSATEEIDATGLTILPGVIDTHVHFNEPGRVEWEGIASGSRALAAGGGTLFADMPLNSAPCTLTGADFNAKLAALQQSSITDFALWGGLVPGNRHELASLAERGVIGFKAFMSDSGLPEFPRADDVTLLEGMREAARLNLPVAVHAESEEITKLLTHWAHQEHRTGIRDYLASRPVVAEVEAITRAALFAAETGARLHIVHVSSPQGVAAAAQARARGVDITIETCPHYLYFTEDDLLALGAVAKCAPPLRPEADRDGLWQAIESGAIDFIASDHSPSDPSLKQGDDFFQIWGGIAGVQSTLAVLLTSGYHQRGITLASIAHLTAHNPATRYRLPHKGQIEPGYDADLCLVDLEASFTLSASNLFQRHPQSPYADRTFQGQVRRTIRRGETIFHDGQITAQTQGKFIRPAL